MSNHVQLHTDVPNLTGWLKQILSGGADRRINKVVNYLFRPTHDASARRKAFRLVIETIAKYHLRAAEDQRHPQFNALADAIVAACIERGEIMVVDELLSREIDINPLPLDRVRVALLIRFLLQVGADAEHTKAFCRMAFPALNE